MSYDIYLRHPVTRKVLEAEQPHQVAGGTYALGGKTEMHLNVTYNYGYLLQLRNLLGERGIRSLYGKTGAESIPILEAAIAQLRDDVSDNYWEPTEGNVKAALRGLLAFARLRPDGVWDGEKEEA